MAAPGQKRSGISRRANTHPAGFHHGHAAGEPVKIGRAHEMVDEPIHGQRAEGA
jgi:hypothetical protein